MEREVVQLLEHIPENLEIDSDPELNDEQQPSTFAAPLAGDPTGTSKRYTGNYPLHRRPLLYVQADLKRRERDRERQDRDKQLLAKWPRGKRLRYCRSVGYGGKVFYNCCTAGVHMLTQ